MPRPEAPLENRPPHLRVLAETLRAVRRDSGLTLAQLAERSHFSVAALSRATSARALPSRALVEVFVRACGVVDVDEWMKQWDLARDRHRAYETGDVTNSSATADRASLADAVRTASGGSADVARAPRTLIGWVKQAQTRAELGAAITMLGARAGAPSLRLMESVSGIAKSTIRDWTAGARRPNRLDDLVVSLGATPAEQREFAQALARVWSQTAPVLRINGRPMYSDVTASRGGHYLVTVEVYEQALESGLVSLATDVTPPGVLGISVGSPEFSSKVGKIALVPKVPRRGSFTIAIAVSSPFEVAGVEVALRVTLQSAEQDWPDQHLTIKLPTTVWASEHHIVLPPTAARRTPPTPVTGRASLAHYTGSAESASADRPSPQDEPNPADRPSSQDEPASADKPTPPSTSSTGTTVIDPATASKQPKHRKVGRTRWNPFRQG